MSKPKLALIPSGYKSGKVYSILPNDATGDFDFERQSIGTRVRKDGLIEEAKTSGSITNVLLYSEDYSQVNWAKTSVTVTTNQFLAPDGTNSADKLDFSSSTSARMAQVINAPAGNYTFSVYLRSVSGSGDFRIRLQSGGGINLTVSLTEQWQRFDLEYYHSGGASLIPYIGYYIDASYIQEVYSWGAMVSEGALSDYIKTEGTTETKTVETFTDVPRLDWYNSNCPSLLLEPQRTNSILQSNDPSGANWTDPLSRWNLLTDTTTAPDGRNVRIIELTESGGSLIRLSGLSISAGTYTVSFYIKDIDGNLSGGSVDIGDEGSGAPTPAFSDVGSDWVRLTRTITTTGTKTYVDLQPSFTGSTNKVAIWGAQVEAGSYATSLIKTEASTVTRLKDECLNGGDSDLFDITEGTFFVDVYAPNSTNSTIISLSNGTDAQKITLLFEAVFSRVRTYSSGGVLYYDNLSYNQRNKILITFKLNEYKTYINGSLVSTYTSATVPSGMDRLNFSNKTNTANHFEGKIYDTRVYNKVLTEAEAIELTTL